MKASIILVALMLGIIISNFFEDRISKRNDFTVESIFEDRLQPSIYLYEMRTLNEQRLTILKDYLIADNLQNQKSLDGKIQLNHQEFDDLLLKYKTTFLVKSEQNALGVLTKNLQLFDEAFNDIANVGNTDFAIAKAKASILRMNENLGQLNKLQIEIGKELLADYKKDTYYSSFLNAFQILLAIVIGVIILIMVANSTLLNKIDKKINLN